MLYRTAAPAPRAAQPLTYEAIFILASHDGKQESRWVMGRLSSLYAYNLELLSMARFRRITLDLNAVPMSTSDQSSAAIAGCIPLSTALAPSD